MMTNMMCRYDGDRDEILVAYVYDEIEPAERVAFDAHLTTCAACRAELTELRGVRAQLGRWAPLEPARVIADDSMPRAGARASVWTRLGEVPAWARVAAALLFLGAAAGLANLDVRYDHEGWSVRTGWSKAPAGVAPGVAQDLSPARSAPWRADLAALERQLRTEFHAAAASSIGTIETAAARSAPTTPAAINDAELLRRVRALVDERDRKQQRELALRVAEVVRDVNAQRQADLVKIDRSLGLIQNNTGVEAMRQRELLNYLVRVSQKQ